MSRFHFEKSRNNIHKIHNILDRGGEKVILWILWIMFLGFGSQKSGSQQAMIA